MSKAQRFRRSIMMLYILEHSFCTFAEIWRFFEPKFNWQDLRNDFDDLVKSGCIILLFNKTCFVKPLPHRYLVWQEFLEKLDRIVLIIKDNPHLANNEFFKEFLDHNQLDVLSQFKKSKMKSSLMKYPYRIDLKRKLNEQLFSKFFKVFLLESKILKLGIDRMSWNKETIFENHSKIDAHLRKMISLFDSLESFLKDYDKPHSEINNRYPNLAKDLDRRYKLVKSYFDAHRSGRKPVEYRTNLLQEINEFSKGQLAKRYGITRKQITNTIKPIIDHEGKAVSSKIMFYLNAETASDLLN